MHSVAGTSAVGSASFSGTKQYGWNEHTEIQNSLIKCADIEKVAHFLRFRLISPPGIAIIIAKEEIETKNRCFPVQIYCNRRINE